MAATLQFAVLVEAVVLREAKLMARRFVLAFKYCSQQYMLVPLSKVVRSLRKARDMTQERLARKAGISQAYLSQLEAGDRKNPSLPTLKKLARAFGVPVAELLE